MTEHERRVNDRDIRAYEDHDTQNLYGKLPGFGGTHEAERQRAIVERNLGDKGTPQKVSQKAEIVLNQGRKTDYTDNNSNFYQYQPSQF